MKLGVFGGTFNPVHLGHLRAALEVAEGFGLDVVRLIVSREPVHKKSEAVAPATDRLKMVELSVAGCPRLEAGDMEIRRTTPSYTVDTLAELSAVHGRDLHFVLGADAFVDIHTWHEWQRLFDLAHFVVVTRPGISAQDLGEYAMSRLAPVVRPAAGRWETAQGWTVTWFSVTAMDISASRIRELVAQGGSCRYLVTETVASFIEEKGLYGTSNS